ncbi:MAG: delta-60 repeat domain-containing protein, partial [Bacteroidota bacterium]
MKSLLPNWLLLLLLLGAQQSLSQINPNYGTAGVSRFSIGTEAEVALCGTLQEDGKLLIAGYTDNGSDLDLFVARLLEDGQLDLSFGNQGIFTYDFNGEDDYVKGLALGPNGTIYFAATTSISGQKDPLIGKLTSYGSFDPAFGASGIVWFNPSTESEEVEALVIGHDGSLFVCGQTKLGDARNGFVLKTQADGSYDSSFGTNGFLELNYPGDDRLEDILLASDGSLFLAGTREGYNQMVVVKLNNQGLLDGTFGQSGFAVYSDPLGVPIGNRLILRPGGEILLGGTITFLDYNHWAVVQFLSNGTIDTDFGSQGLIAMGNPGQWSFINGMELMSDHSVLIAGNSSINWETKGFWGRIDASGNLDLNVGASGFETYSDVSQEAIVNGIVYSE